MNFSLIPQTYRIDFAAVEGRSPIEITCGVNPKLQMTLLKLRPECLPETLRIIEKTRNEVSKRSIMQSLSDPWGGFSRLGRIPRDSRSIFLK